MGVRVYTVEDHGNVREHLADDVKGACGNVSQSLRWYEPRDTHPTHNKE